MSRTGADSQPQEGPATAAQWRERPESLPGVRAFYKTGEEIVLRTLPAETCRVIARRARGDRVDAEWGEHVLFPGLASGTYSIEALGAEGRVLAEELTTVGAHPGERPVHGFATSFGSENVAATLEWLRALRCTVVQIYDWMASYSAPLGPLEGWKDPSGRDVSFKALRALASGLRANGAVAHAYAPLYAVDLPVAAEHPAWLMARNDGAAQRFLDMIRLADPACPDWQHHFAAAYGSAADSIGFNGFHLDTYGYPRAARNQQGQPLDMRAAYESFLAFFRAARPSDTDQLQPGERRPVSRSSCQPARGSATARCGRRTTGGGTWKG